MLLFLLFFHFHAAAALAFTLANPHSSQSRSIESTKEIMHNNINSMMEREEKLEDLEA